MSLTFEDYQRLARERLRPEVSDFIDGGSDSEQTLADNRHAFSGWRIRPRVLVDVEHCDPGTQVFGARLPVPVGLAPTAYHRLAHADGEVATARGAGAVGALFIVSIFASRRLEDIAAAADCPLWLQLYWLKDRELLVDLVARAKAAGFQALVLTVDTPRLGRRLRDLRNGFAVDSTVDAVNLTPEVMAATHERRVGESALAVHAARTFNQTISWTDLAWLREMSGLPLVLKGLLTAEDAALAVQHGVDAVIVSNHGGRQLDRAIPTLEALPEVVDAVAGACPVLFDGGVRTGTDAFVALALGASVVLVGRPALWALAVDGEAWVAASLTSLRDELVHTMALAGRPTLADIDRSAVRFRGP